MYSFTHLSMAKEILASTAVDMFGVPLYSQDDKVWAFDVAAWFQNIYKAARSMVGAWCARIKFVWQSIKNRLAAKHIRAKLSRVTVNRTTKDVVLFFNTGSYAVFNCPVAAASYWGNQPFRHLVKFINAIR